MNQLPGQRVNQEIPTSGANGDRPNVIEDQPFDGGDELGLDGGQIGSDRDPGRIGIRVGPGESENEGSVGEGEGVVVEGAEKVWVVDEPAFLAGAQFAELFARYAPQFGRVASLRHCCFRRFHEILSQFLISNKKNILILTLYPILTCSLIFFESKL